MYKCTFPIGTCIVHHSISKLKNIIGNTYFIRKNQRAFSVVLYLSYHIHDSLCVNNKPTIWEPMDSVYCICTILYVEVLQSTYIVGNNDGVIVRALRRKKKIIESILYVHFMLRVYEPVIIWCALPGKVPLCIRPSHAVLFKIIYVNTFY